MPLDSVAQLNLLERGREMSIIGLEMRAGRIFDTLAQKHAGFRNYHQKIFRDQILTSIRQIEYFHSLNPKDETSCCMQKLALETLFRIYSFGLKENSLMSKEEDIDLAFLLMKIFDQPYGYEWNSEPSDSTKVASQSSPLWTLSDLSLQLLRLLVFNHWVNINENLSFLLKKKLGYLLRSTHLFLLEEPNSSRRVANVAHIMCKMIDTPREMFLLLDSGTIIYGVNFVSEVLFPLACEFAAKEYPATIIDPIGHYKLFESSGKLNEPDEVLDIWQRHHGDSLSKHEHPGNRSGDPFDINDKQPLLPSTHAILEQLIFTYISLSPEKDQLDLIKFLQRKILEVEAIVSEQNEDITIGEREKSKLPLVSKIVALNILGRINYHHKPEDLFSFISVLILPTLKSDPLLMKICKFQLFGLFTIEEAEVRQTILESFLGEFIKLHSLTSADDQYKQLLIFVTVGSRCLYRMGEPLMRHLFSAHLRGLSRESQMKLVDTIISLFFEYKIVDPLILLRIIITKNHTDESFARECELKLTKVIDSIAGQLLLLLIGTKRNQSRRDRALCLLSHLYRFTSFRTLPLPDETAEKLLKLVQIYLLSNDPHLTGDNDLNWTQGVIAYLTCALKFPPEKQTQATALYLLDQLLDQFKSQKRICETKLAAASLILGHLSWFSVTSPPTCPQPINGTTNRTSNGTTNGTTNGITTLNSMRHSLFDPQTSPDRISQIHKLCETDGTETNPTSTWIMSTLMSWPASSAATIGALQARQTTGNTSSLYWLKQYLIELALTRLEIFDEKEKKKSPRQQQNLLSTMIGIDSEQIFKTRDNLLFALMAAFNSSPKLLESYLEHAKGEVSSGGDSHLKTYVKLWLDAVTRAEDSFWQREIKEDTFIAKSYMYISYQTLISIHKARTEDKLAFSIKGLTNQLNSARRIVLNWLRNSHKQAISSASPLINFYATTMSQLEQIGNIK